MPHDRPDDTTTQATAAPRQPPIALFIMVTSVGPFAINAFLPSIPRLVVEFGSDLTTAQLALTLYLVGIALGQLVWGPLSDRFGRRPMLLLGLGVSLVAGLAGALAPSIEVLVASRWFQAIGACAGLVLGRAMVRDIHGRDKAASMIGYITMVMAVVPMLAPAIGGYLDDGLGWRAVFAAMALLSAAALAFAVTHGHETHHHRLAIPSAWAMAREYGELIAHRDFIAFTATSAFVNASFFAFLAAGPYLMIRVLERPASEYGLYFVAVSIAYMIGNFLAGRWSQRLGADRMVRLGVMVASPAIAVQLLAAFHWELAPLVIFLPMICASTGVGMTLPNAVAGAISVNPRLAGAASGLIGFTQMMLGAAATVVVAHFENGTLAPMALVMAACTTSAFIAAHMIRPLPR